MSRMEDLTMVLKASATELGISKAAKSVLSVMAAYANQDGVCWPSRAEVEAATGWSARTVTDAISLLSERGFLARSMNQRTHTYRLNYSGIRAALATQTSSPRYPDAQTPLVRLANPASETSEPRQSDWQTVHRNKEEQTIEQTNEHSRVRDLNPHDALGELEAAYPSECQRRPAFHRQALVRAADRWRDAGESEPFRRIVEAAREFAKSPAGRRGRFTPLLHNWLDADEHRAPRESWHEGATERGDKAEREAQISAARNRVAEIARMSESEREPLVRAALERWPHLASAVDSDPNSNERRALYAACAKIERERAA